jgi:hypothetical protein
MHDVIGRIFDLDRLERSCTYVEDDLGSCNALCGQRIENFRREMKSCGWRCD